MADYVRLIANPRRRHRRRHHRNPDFGKLVRQTTRDLPKVEELVGAVVGGTVALQLPAMLKATQWANVAWTAVGAVGAAAVMRAVASTKAAATAGLAGGLMTLFKVAHIATDGRFGIQPELRVTDIAVPARAAAARLATRVAPVSSFPVRQIAPSMGPASSRAGVAAFRESEFRGMPPAIEESLLT